jgi:hypothetical protein
MLTRLAHRKLRLDQRFSLACDYQHVCRTWSDLWCVTEPKFRQKAFGTLQTLGNCTGSEFAQSFLSVNAAISTAALAVLPFSVASLGGHREGRLTVLQCDRESASSCGSARARCQRYAHHVSHSPKSNSTLD